MRIRRLTRPSSEVQIRVPQTGWVGGNHRTLGANPLQQGYHRKHPLRFQFGANNAGKCKFRYREDQPISDRSWPSVFLGAYGLIEEKSSGLDECHI